MLASAETLTPSIPKKTRRRITLATDYQKYRVAERLIKHGMQTRTICDELDLTENVVRQLKISIHGKASKGGTSIICVSTAIESIRESVSASVFARLWIHKIGHPDASYSMDDLVDAYESYLQILGDSAKSNAIGIMIAHRITKELSAKNQREPLKLVRCNRCALPYLYTPNNDAMINCPHCRMVPRRKSSD